MDLLEDHPIVRALTAARKPPDPTFSGAYDGVDYDDVVLLTTSEGVAASSLLVDFGEISLVVPVPSLEKEPAWTLSVSPLQPRLPPSPCRS